MSLRRWVIVWRVESAAQPDIRGLEGKKRKKKLVAGELIELARECFTSKII